MLKFCVSKNIESRQIWNNEEKRSRKHWLHVGMGIKSMSIVCILRRIGYCENGDVLSSVQNVEFC